MSRGARLALSVILLVFGLPAYVMCAVSLVNLLGRPPLLLELFIYAALGLLWIIPFRFLLNGRRRRDGGGEDSGGHER